MRAQSPSATAVFACSIVPFHSKTRTPASSSAGSRRATAATAPECRSRPAPAAARRRRRARRPRAPERRRSCRRSTRRQIHRRWRASDAITRSRRYVPGRVGRAGNHAQAHVAGRRAHVRRVDAIGLRRLAATGVPDRLERARQLGDGRAADLDARVAPRLHPPRRVAQPFRADAQPRDEADAAVDDDGLAVIARQPAERTVEARPIEREDARAGIRQLRPQRTGAT